MSQPDVRRAKISRGCPFCSLGLTVLDVGKLFGVREDSWNQIWQVRVIRNAVAVEEPPGMFSRRGLRRVVVDENVPDPGRWI